MNIAIKILANQLYLNYMKFVKNSQMKKNILFLYRKERDKKLNPYQLNNLKKIKKINEITIDIILLKNKYILVKNKYI